MKKAILAGAMLVLAAALLLWFWAKSRQNSDDDIARLGPGVTTSFTPPASQSPSPSAQTQPTKAVKPVAKPTVPTAVAGWRVWGGAQRDFLSTSVGLFKPGSEKLANPPKKLWERALGDGYSAVATEGDRLYTAYRREASDVVTALDAATGQPIWEFAYPAPFKNDYSDGVGPGPYLYLPILGPTTGAIGGGTPSSPTTAFAPLCAMSMPRTRQSFAGPLVSRGSTPSTITARSSTA